MGSGNSVPVEKARTVETEAHQDVFELRLDHLAMGSTVILILIVLALIYWCLQQKKARRHRRVTQTTTACCHQAQAWMTMTPPLMPAMMPPRYMEMMPMMTTPTTTNPRFTEIYEEPSAQSPQRKAPVNPGTARPIRPPLPEPVPRLQATPETPKP